MKRLESVCARFDKKTLFVVAVALGLCPHLQGQNAPACGTVLASYNSIPAYSNGVDQWTENDCDPNDALQPYGAYGEQFQCTEYVKRYYAQALGVASATNWIGDAIDWSSTSWATSYGLTFFSNGGSVPPAANDILTFSDPLNGVGHVAIVTNVSGSSGSNPTVIFIEQNWSITEGTTLPSLSYVYSCASSGCSYTVSDRYSYNSSGQVKATFQVLGWIRSTSSVTTNPTPSISLLQPASLLVGSPAQTLTINGTGFITSSTATFNGTARPTTFVSSTQITIPLSATDLQSAGSYPVVVVNPGPGGGPSSPKSLTISNPVPSISNLSPSSLTAGAPAQQLTINGSGFVNDSSVTFNGLAHIPKFVSASQLTISLSASDLSTAGTFPVEVTNLAPGGGSSSYSFTIGNVTALQGKVLNGQQPIVGASVYLYAANTTGYQNASASLLTSASGTSKDSSGNYYVTTDSTGSFTIPSGYTCPNASSQVYLYAIGGNPGSGVNSASGLLTALGSCTNLSASTSVVVNEVSTITTAYALAGYATDATHVSSSATTLAQTGVANAFATVANLETMSTGTALATTPGGNGIVPQNKINTLANILAACVNSTSAGSAACNTLFSNAKNGTVVPTDTATAAINIAHNPGANVSTLYGLQTASTAFQPMLSAAPNDFTIAVEIDYTGGGTTNSNAIAIDGSGNVWITDSYGPSIRKVSSTGVVFSGSSGYTGGGLNGPYWISVDAVGNVWVDNAYSLGNRLSKFSASGNAISSSAGYTGGGLNDGYGAAIDASGNIWSANNAGKSLSKFNSSGSAISSSSGYIGGGLNSPTDIAIDTSGNVWVVNSNNSISKFSSGGAAISASSGYIGGGLNTGGTYTISPIAVDGSGNIWVANSQANSLSKFGASGSAISPSSGYIGGGLNSPNDIAIDGSGNVWAANIGNGSISKFNASGTALSGSLGYTANGMTIPGYVAIDGSGNVWVGMYQGQRIFEFVGAATPVVTPTVANLLSPYGSSAVNKP